MQLHWVHAEPIPEPDRATAEQRIRALAEGNTDLIDVRISVRTTAHHRQGDQEVRITCDARGKELVASRTRPEAGLALNEALDSFEREVRRMRERRVQQRAERPPEPPELGVVDRVLFDRGYGFILTDDGEQVYFHRNAVRGLVFEELSEGQRVGLNIEAGIKGPQATVVLDVPPGVPAP